MRCCGRAVRMLLGVLCLLMIGCGPSSTPAEHFEDYLARLARTLKLDPDWSAVHGDAVLSTLRQQKPNIPRIQSRVWSLDEVSKASLMMYLRIDGCSELKQWVAKRNNQMGRHQAIPYRLEHEIAVRRALRNCADQAEDEADLEEVMQMIETKQDTFAADIWNTLFASAWFSQFAHSHQWTPWESAAGVSASAQALEFFSASIADARAGRYDRALQLRSDYVTWYQQIDGYNTLGQLVTSMHFATHYLNIGTHWLQSVDTTRYCPPGLKRKEHTYFKNVIIKYFVGRVQPYASRLSREGGRLLRAMDSLLIEFERTPGLMSYWQDVYRAPDSVWHRFNDAVKHHAQAISALNDQCRLGLTPTRQ